MPDLHLIKQAEQGCGTGAWLPRAAPAIPTVGSASAATGNRVSFLRLASSGVAGYVTSRPRSSIGALCVIQPLEIRSTPVAAMIGGSLEVDPPGGFGNGAGQAVDLAQFTSLGIDPTRYCTVAVKSMQHFRPPSSRSPVRSCSSTPAPYCSEIYTPELFTKVRRPIWPLDPIPDPNAP